MVRLKANVVILNYISVNSYYILTVEISMNIRILVILLEAEPTSPSKLVLVEVKILGAHSTSNSALGQSGDDILYWAG